jgi:hypothetical protein
MRELTKCGNCIVWITKSRPENLRGVQPNIECRYINHKAQKKKKKKKAMSLPPWCHLKIQSFLVQAET